jgi:hypothetical protein
MQKSSILKFLPFVVAMIVGVYAAGFFATDKEVPFGRHDMDENACLGFGHEDCEHDNRDGRRMRRENRELKRRLMELEQRLKAIENKTKSPSAGADRPVADFELPVS